MNEVSSPEIKNVSLINGDAPGDSIVTTAPTLDGSTGQEQQTTVPDDVMEGEAGPTDNHKRAFLKLAGLAGLSMFAYFALPKKAEALVMGSTPTSNVVGMKNSANVRIDPATETTVAGIKTKTDRLTFDGSNNLNVQAAAGFSSQIENAASTIINPATEETLALIKTQTNKMTFDGSGNLLTAGGAAASIVGLKDITSTQVNPATDDGIVYLRRMVKLMESQANVDAANRQRISLDTIPAGVTLPTVTNVGTVGVVSSITAGTITTVGTLTTITNAVPVGNVATFDGHNRQMFQDVARNAYANGLRQNIIFS
jgi:hypothetical protein